MPANKPAPEIESAMLAIGLAVIGAAMLIWPTALEGAVASGRRGLIKEVLIAV